MLTSSQKIFLWDIKYFGDLCACRNPLPVHVNSALEFFHWWPPGFSRRLCLPNKGSLDAAFSNITDLISGPLSLSVIGGQYQTRFFTW